MKTIVSYIQKLRQLRNMWKYDKRELSIGHNPSYIHKPDELSFSFLVCVPVTLCLETTNKVSAESSSNQPELFIA
jgi:hypothetical protein